GLVPAASRLRGKVKSRRVRRGSDLAARAFRLAAQGCHHAKHALGAFYRRIQARCGGIKAVFATARKIAERVYRLLKYGVAYVRQGIEAKVRASKCCAVWVSNGKPSLLSRLTPPSLAPSRHHAPSTKHFEPSGQLGHRNPPLLVSASLIWE